MNEDAPSVTVHPAGRPPSWRVNGDGAPLIRVRLAVELSLDDVAMILARLDADGVAVAALTGEGLRQQVRQALLGRGDAMRDRDDDLLADRHYQLAVRAYGEPS